MKNMFIDGDEVKIFNDKELSDQLKDIFNKEDYIKIINKIMLEPEEIDGFLVVDKGQKDAGKHHGDEQGKHQDRHPGFGWKNGLGINVEF